MATSASASGRPRDPRIDMAVYAAAQTLLAEQGYTGLTLDAVARRAGVARATLYRRWGTKPALVHEAVFSQREDRLVDDTGDFGADLRAFALRAARYYHRPEALAALPGLLADLRADPQLHERLARNLMPRAVEEFRALVAGAVARGEAAPDTDADALFTLVSGGAMFAVLIHRVSPDARLARTLTDPFLPRG